VRYLHFGCGSHHLPFPWENYDKEIDIRERLPFRSQQAQFILAEHVIEHIPFRDGLFFLSECHRVLIPGGVLRLSFPDITRIEEKDVELYAQYLERETAKHITSIEEVIWSIASDWGHVSIWTNTATFKLLSSLKFSTVEMSLGFSHHAELTGVDGRHLSEGFELARAETTVLEATKPL